MSLLTWNPICDSLLYYLLEKRCPALAKQFKDLFFPRHIDVTNDDLTHLVDYFSKPSKRRGLPTKVNDPERKKIKLETTDKHEKGETLNSVATLQERETGKVTSAVLETSTDSSSDDDNPVIVTPVKKPAAPVVELSSGSSSSSSDSDTEEDTFNSKTPTSSAANSAANRCDFSARHTCQASPIPSTSSHDQGKVLKAPGEATLCSKNNSENSKVRKSNSSHKSDSFFNRLMGGSSFPQVTSDGIRDKTKPSSPYISSSSGKKVSKTVASPTCVSNKSAKSKVPSACSQSTPKSVISPACSLSTTKSVISPAPTPKSVISPAPTPKSVISPASTPKSVISPASTPKSVISPASTPKSVISPASTPKSVISPASTPKSVISPASTPKSVISPACSQPTPRLCRYGMDCRRRLAGDCQFTHTASRKESEEPRVGPGGRRICRYGGDCRRMLYCNYEHVL